MKINNILRNKIFGTITIILTALIVLFIIFGLNTISNVLTVLEVLSIYVVFVIIFILYVVGFVVVAFFHEKIIEYIHNYKIKKEWLKKFDMFGHIKYVSIYFVVLAFYLFAGVMLSRSIIANIGEAGTSSYVGVMVAFVILFLYRFSSKYKKELSKYCEKEFLDCKKKSFEFIDFQGIMVSIVLLSFTISAATGFSPELPKDDFFPLLLIVVPVVDIILIEIINLPKTLVKLFNYQKTMLKNKK
ncbi:MAG: hypothetical protein PHP82_02825 [Candidatus ainarchaeum sp.]|nr:hypothetical protein [Candidatus ainarchaeum sp.]